LRSTAVTEREMMMERNRTSPSPTLPPPNGTLSMDDLNTTSNEIMTAATIGSNRNITTVSVEPNNDTQISESSDDNSFIVRSSVNAPPPPPPSSGSVNNNTIGTENENNAENNDNNINAAMNNNEDPHREARARWIRINRRFQLIITIVALIFSLLLFSILVCWVVLTSAYVVSIDKHCDVPLKTYFWCASLQLILDVFRNDIMRHVLRWDRHSQQRVPPRVILYYFTYLIYAMSVLRLGIISVFLTNGSTCPSTAPELFQASTIFVFLSIGAWSTIILGYLVPFCFVAIILTRNGYSPTSDFDVMGGRMQRPAAGVVPGVFPTTYMNSGAPPECVDQLSVVSLEDFPEHYPKDCCICMGDFAPGEVIVETECHHVFHKRCCKEWLRQARTCPVCRTDIPDSFVISNVNTRDQTTTNNRTEQRNNEVTQPQPTQLFHQHEFHQEVASLLQILRQHEQRLRGRNANMSETESVENATLDAEMPTANSTGVSSAEEQSLPFSSQNMISAEEGRSRVQRTQHTA